MISGWCFYTTYEYFFESIIKKIINMTSPEVASPETGNKREIISRVFPGISRVFPGTPLDSRYEQWNCEFNQS
jgi:hypothetical protein